MSAYSQRIALLLFALPLASACQSRPEDLPAALESALLRHDRPAALALVDHASQPLIEAAMNSVSTAAESPYWLHPGHPGHAGPAPMHVVKSDLGESGLVLTVESEGVKRDWALVQEGGSWKLDLAGTAARRAWDVTYRDGK
jgi:hypothetical protein